MNTEAGLLLIDKPYGWTSFDVVNKTRQMIRSIIGHKIKVGHTGTLDPLATGLLVLCYGKATKKIEELTGLDKEYITTLEFGKTTASFDREQPVDGNFEYSHITESDLKDKLVKFTGDIMQVPPLHSAKWINGRRAYEYARKGQDPEIEARAAFVNSIELIEFTLPRVILKISCGKGFYVRSFARDLGNELNSGAYITDLRRTKVGQFSIEKAISIEKLQDYLLNNE